VRAIVAYEPGSNFVFPESEVPPPMPSANGTLEGVAIPLSDFMQLTKIPIVIYLGDNIPETPTSSPGGDPARTAALRVGHEHCRTDLVEQRRNCAGDAFDVEGPRSAFPPRLVDEIDPEPPPQEDILKALASVRCGFPALGELPRDSHLPVSRNPPTYFRS
jgi:hypothetical protein